MTKYGITLTLQTVSQYDKVTFEVKDCDTMEEAEEQMQKWISEHKLLMERALNKEIVKVTLNG